MRDLHARDATTIEYVKIYSHVQSHYTVQRVTTPTRLCTVLPLMMMVVADTIAERDVVEKLHQVRW